MLHRSPDVSPPSFVNVSTRLFRFSHQLSKSISFWRAGSVKSFLYRSVNKEVLPISQLCYMQIQQLLKMAGANMLVHVTHIDDSVRGRQGPCVYFWGMTHDRSLYLLMEKYLESIRHYLEARVPPLNLNVLNQVCCVLINHQWHRARVPELKLSHAGTIDVFCIDSGDTHTVPLAFVRTLDIPGMEAEHIRDWPPLATKFILADVVAPRGPGSRSHWSEPAVMFLKMHVENRTWKASHMGMYGEHQGVRLFDSNNQLLATIMIQQGLGVAAQTYHEALSMCEMMDKQPDYIKPAFNAFSDRLNVPTVNNTLPPAFAIPATYRDHHPAYPMAATRSPKQSPVPPRTYVTNDIPSKGRHDVIVTHIPDGPYKFYVQLKSEASDFLRLRKKLDSTAPPALRGIPKLGTTCVALSPSDKLCHRGLITAVDDYGEQCTVYFADIGTQEPVNLDSIREISDELLIPRLFAYRVSLYGVEDLAKLVGLNEIFSALVKNAPYLQVEVVGDDEGKQKVNLYDNLGRSIREVLSTILVNFVTSRVCSPVAPIPSPPKLNKATTACITEIPSADIASEEMLFVILPEEPGCFFGQLEKIPVKDLNDMVAELTMAYSTDPNPPLLYADVKSHLGHFGVIHWDEDNKFYRIRVIKELVNDAEIRFIDYGNSLQIPRCKILAPLEGLTCFRNPPYGIHCKIEGGVMQSIPNWRELVNEKQIKVKIGSLVDGSYSVTLTDDPCNNDIATAISSANTPKNQVVSVPEQSTRSDNAHVQVENVSEQPVRPNNDRFRRNNDNGNSGRSHYVHPNAKDTNWRTAGTEDTTQTGQVRTSSKDCNWRSSSNQVQEVIRAPRGPPPSTGNEVTKGPMGFQRLGQVEKSQPPPLKPIIEISLPAVIPEKPKLLTVSAVQKQYTYLHQALPVANSQVQITCVVDPTSFYVQLSANSTILTELVEKLNQVYSDERKPFIQNAKPGSACVVQYEEDSRWYRGKILQLNEGQLVTVLFVDYGNTQRSSLKQLKAIDEEFVQLPPQAFRCRLSGIGNSKTWTVEDKNKLEACTTDKPVVAMFAERDSSGKFPVRLMDGSKVINEAFGAPNSTAVPPPSAGYQYLPVSQAPIDVSIAWYYNPGRIFTSPVDLSAYQNELDELEEFYSSLSPDELLEDQPVVGLPCVARFTEDERYYRSKILSVVDQVAKVLFVDYGNEQETPIAQLKRMVPRFMQCPQLTWHSRLKGVKKMTSGPVNPEPQKYIAACFLTGQSLTALFHSTSPDGNNGVFEADFNVPGIGDAANYLIEQRVLDRVVLDTQIINLAPQILNFAPGQIISTSAIVPYFESPTEFWIQIQPKLVDTIMERIEKWALDPQFINKKDFKASIGKPCLAFFADDGCWYRALVEAVDGETAKVNYIDYGNCSMVKTIDLRQLPEEFAQQPALAFKCCVHEVIVFHECVAKAFENCVMELESMMVKCFSVVDGVLHVRLYSSEAIDLYEKLIPKVSVEERAEDAMHVPPAIPEEPPIQDFPEQVDTVYQEAAKSPYVKVYISYSLSPNQFWFQMRENDDKLCEISTQMTEMYNADVESFRITENPVVGQLYGMKHPSYDGWYRSQIKEVDGDTVIAQFIDYGDTHTIQIRNIFNLPQRLAEIPAMAMPGTLKTECSQAIADKFNTLCYEPDKIHWVLYGTDENGKQCIKSLFIGDDNVLDLLAVETVQSSATLCETISKDAGLSTISETFLEQSSRSTEDEGSRIISSTGDSSSVFLPYEELSSICPSTLGAEVTVEESTAEMTIEESTAEMTIEESGTDVAVEGSGTDVTVEMSVAEVTVEESSLLPVMDLNYAPGQKMSTYALAPYIESATEVWLQLEPAAVDSLMEEIAGTDVSQLATFEPQIGGHCLALFPDDGQWYRALVNSLDGEKAHVTYIDYGNYSLVNVGDLRVLTTRFAQQPGLALKCALDGTQQNVMSSPTPDQCISTICEEVLSVVFVGRTPEHLYVRLFEPSGLDLNEKLGLPESFKVESVANNLLDFNSLDDVEMSSPMSRTSEPALFDTFDEDVTLPLEVEVIRKVIEEPLVAIPTVIEHTENEEVELVDRMEQVTVQESEFYQCFGESVDSFVQEAVLKPIMELKEAEVMEQLAILDEEVKVAGVITDDLAQDIAAFVSDAGNAAKDFNVSEPNEGLNVSALSENLNLPEPKSSGEDVSPNFIVHLTDAASATSPLESSLIDATQLIEDPDVTLLSEAAGVTETTEVTEIGEVVQIHDEPVQEVTSKVADALHDERVVLEMKTEMISNEGTSKVADVLYDERVVMQMKTEMIANEGEMSKGCVYVSHIVSPGDFWIQLADDEQAIGDIDHKLVDLGVEDSHQYFLTGPPIVGKLYAAKHPEYGYWYRAKLLKIDEDRAEVIFVDYGDKQILPVACIRLLSRVLQYIPPMAIRCKLSAVHLDCWPDEATEVMKSICQPEYLCKAGFKAETGPIHEVESLSVGDVDVVNAVLSHLKCGHPVDGSPQPTIPTELQPLSPPQSLSSAELPQFDAKLIIFTELESTKTSQDLSDDTNRLPVD